METHGFPHGFPRIFLRILFDQISTTSIPFQTEKMHHYLNRFWGAAKAGRYRHKRQLRLRHGSTNETTDFRSTDACARRVKATELLRTPFGSMRTGSFAFSGVPRRYRSTFSNFDFSFEILSHPTLHGFSKNQPLINQKTTSR